MFKTLKFNVDQKDESGDTKDFDNPTSHPIIFLALLDIKKKYFKHFGLLNATQLLR